MPAFSCRTRRSSTCSPARGPRPDRLTPTQKVLLLLQPPASSCCCRRRRCCRCGRCGRCCMPLTPPPPLLLLPHTPPLAAAAAAAATAAAAGAAATVPPTSPCRRRRRTAVGTSPRRRTLARIGMAKRVSTSDSSAEPIEAARPRRRKTGCRRRGCRPTADCTSPRGDRADPQ